MNCMNCGAPLPDSAQFCNRCGTRVGATAPGAAPVAYGGVPPPPPPAAAPAKPSIAPAGVQELKCQSCGAPLHPVFGDMVITCEYCGTSVTLGGAGWKEVNKHTMLPLKVATVDQALGIVRQMIDTGMFHKKDFEESTIEQQKLSYVPYWVVPASATTNYTYQDVTVGVGTTVGSVAAAALISGALGGRRGGGFYPMPMMMGPAVNPTRQDTIAGTYEYPVVAVKSMSAYQPKNYAFQMQDRTLFDRKQLPSDATVLNGDLGEDSAQHSARSYVMQLQADAAHKKHHMVSQIQSQIELSDAELLHVPIWYFVLDRKGQKTVILVDGNAGKPMQTVQ